MPRSEQPDPNATRAAEERDRQLRFDLRRLAEIEADRKLKFQGRSRIEAGRYMRRLYQETRRSGFRRAEIQDRIAARCTGFRLDNWILPKDCDVIDDAIVAAYENRATPQKKVGTYLVMIEVMAALLDRDPAALKIDLLAKTSLWERRRITPPEGMPEVEPAQRLGALLHACALSIAKRCDLAGLFEKARRLNAGWALEKGPVAFERSEALDNASDPRTPAVGQFPTPDQLPPYPTAALARIPTAVCEVDLFVEDPVLDEFEGAELDPATGAPLFPHITARARLVEYADLFLSIAPVNAFGDIGATLMEHASVEVRLLSPDAVAGSYDGWVFDIGAFTAADGWAPSTSSGRRTIAPPSVDLCRLTVRRAGEIGGRLPKTDWVHRPPIRFHAVDAKHVASWLTAEGPVGFEQYGSELCENRIRETGQISNTLINSLALSFKKSSQDYQWWEDGPDQINEHPGGQMWFEHRGYLSVAGDIEDALLSGRLERRFISWIDKYRASLDAFERDWIERAESTEQKLRERWREAERDGRP